MSNPDGKPVVVVDGVRHGAVQETQKAAQEEAAKLNKLNESESTSPKKAVVKTHLCG